MADQQQNSSGDTDRPSGELALPSSSSLSRRSPLGEVSANVASTVMFLGSLGTVAYLLLEKSIDTTHGFLLLAALALHVDGRAALKMILRR